MIELKNFPLRNQLKDVPSADGKPAENASYDCVPTSLAACIQYYTGRVVAADDLKDAVYGQGHVGGGAELTYATYVEQHYGLKLGYEPLPSASQQIIDRLRYWLARGVPCIVTMHSQWSRLWNADRGDGLHVGTAFAISETDAGVLHIANPWRGFDHVQPVSWWRDRLGIGVWPVQRLGLGRGLDGWHDDGTTLTAPNGQVIVHGFRAKVLADAQTAAGWQGGQPYGPEYNDGADGSVQPFAATLLLWNPRQNVYEGSMADALRIVAHEHQGKAA